MTGQPHMELSGLLHLVRRRWRLLVGLRAWTLAATAAAALLGLTLLAQWLFAPEAWNLVLLWGTAGLGVLCCFASAVMSIRSAPGDLQLARFVEERCPELDDALLTAVEQMSIASPMATAVIGDAVRRVQTLDSNRIVSAQALRRVAFGAGAASVALIASGVWTAQPVAQATRLLGLYLFPDRIAIDVSPGDVKVRAGDPLRVVATISSGTELTPVLRVGEGAGVEWRETRMEMSPEGFSVAFDQVEQDFRYTVAVAGAKSREYSVKVIRPPKVERIDLRYEYPPAFRMPIREEKDGGDIYGPAGTRVQVTVHTDKPVTQAALNVTGGVPLALESRGDVLEGELTIAQDGSYRVALTDSDGLGNTEDTEYFIRTLQDRPPDVRIVRPAADRQVTPIDEVSIEARADDDFGVASLDLVYSIGAGVEKALPFDREGSRVAASGRRTLYLEDLDLAPGDVVAYYARARDISRGKRATEARSDIFFLEIVPFEGEFVASQSQGAGSGDDDDGLETLIQEQKDIVTATWNLDRRARQASGRADGDIRAVARAQRELRGRVANTLSQQQRAGDVRRRRVPGGRGAPTEPDPMADAVAKAVEAMASALQQLEALSTSSALPHEMAALNELLKAQAEVRQREVQQQANGNGGRGSNSQRQDLSSLFDRELARQQETNYETPPTQPGSEAKAEDAEAIEKLRELARRQDALNNSQQELIRNRPNTSPEQLRRELERLTREQGELRREAEDLARQLRQDAEMPSRQSASQAGDQGERSERQQGQQGQQGEQSQQGQQGQQGQPGGQGGQGGQDGDSRQQASRELQRISEDMQGAANELRKEDPQQASARGQRAADRLRDLEQRMRGAQPDDRRRALGDLQLESRQLADAQRRLGNGATGTETAGDRADRARRKAGEQGRLADRAERLEQAVQQVAKTAQGLEPSAKDALTDAVQEIEEQRPSQRMRAAARAGQETGATLGREGENIARALDRLGDHLAGASGQAQGSERLTEELSRIRQLREELVGLNRQLADLREKADGVGGGTASGGRQGKGSQGGAQSGRGTQSGGVENGDAHPWQAASDLLNELQRENRIDLSGEADGFNPGRSAPGTEAWKQDFAAWDELKIQLAAALERAEISAADQLRDRQSRDRLNAGASQAAPESYRRLVERYYRALASENRKQGPTPRTP